MLKTSWRYRFLVSEAKPQIMELLTCTGLEVAPYFYHIVISPSNSERSPFKDIGLAHRRTVEQFTVKTRVNTILEMLCLKHRSSNQKPGAHNVTSSGALQSMAKLTHFLVTLHTCQIFHGIIPLICIICNSYDTTLMLYLYIPNYISAN